MVATVLLLPWGSEEGENVSLDCRRPQLLVLCAHRRTAQAVSR
jgi:hypothetical protein